MFRGFDQDFDLQDLIVRHAIATVLILDKFVECFEIFKLNDWKLGPLGVRFKTGL